MKLQDLNESMKTFRSTKASLEGAVQKVSNAATHLKNDRIFTQYTTPVVQDLSRSIVDYNEALSRDWASLSQQSIDGYKKAFGLPMKPEPSIVESDPLLNALKQEIDVSSLKVIFLSLILLVFG
jgi:hypothetical protein